jgi:PAS domain S-box-containing protein
MNINLHHKEIRFIFLVFILIAALILGSKINTLYQIDAMKKSTEEIFNFPFKNANATLKIESEVHKMHRDMKDIVLSISSKELERKIVEVNNHEQHVYTYLAIVRESAKNKEGRELERQTRELFRAWKPIRDEVIRLVHSGHRDEAITITKGKGAKHVLALEHSTLALYRYTKNEANISKKHSDSIHINFHYISLLNAAAVLILLSLIAYYSLSRISRYISKSAHLTDVLTVIRNVNQLIVREKNIQKLVQEICNILVANRAYSNAWIVLYGKDQSANYICGTDTSENFASLKNKMYAGWIPTCIRDEDDRKDGYVLINSTKESCPECPFTDLYENNGAFSIQLKHNGKLYGNLTLRLNTVYFKDQDEFLLLQEVAGDIAYALYNIEMENHLKDRDILLNNYKELYENIIDSVDNIIFVKDTNFTYLACNQAFEKFIGKPNHEIIGKTDYELVSKELADFFRKHDEMMFADKKAKSNFEWVTYPDGHEVYLFTVKSPLLNSSGDILGLVGNSADLTEQKNAEDALKESEERFSLMMHQSPSVIELYDLEGTQIEVNHAYEELWKFPAEHTVHSFNLFRSEEVKKTGLLDYIQKAYRGEIVTVPPFEFDSTGQTEANGIGRKRWLKTRIYPLKSSEGKVKNIVITHEDFTEKHDNYKQLEQKKKELETIIQEAPNPIMLHNENGKVLMVNRIWESLSGYTHEEINTVEKWAELACSKNKPLMREYMEKIYSLEHKIDMGEASVTTKDGNTLIWQFSSAPLGIIDGKQTVVTTAMDITELKKKDELMMSQSRHAAMGEMIGMIAHQWRQPIAGIAMDANNMLLDIAFDTFDSTAATKYAQEILDQTTHLSKTIDDFRNFFKPDKSVASIKVEDIFEDTLAIVKESLINNAITINTSYRSESLVDAYPRELMQVFVNIINNAKDSLLYYHTKNAHIDVDIYDDGEYVNTEICDNGVGIDVTILPKIFDPYFSTKDEKTGTGLGLYMSKMIIEEHLHGFIEATNNTFGGACFKIRLLKNQNSVSTHNNTVID